jgi:E3 ubiquitin-protein ligase HERC3
MSAGVGFVLASTSDGPYGWGRNAHGQLALGFRSQRVARPARMLVPKRRRVLELEAGYWHALLLLAPGEVWSAGRNSHGQLGLGASCREPCVPIMQRVRCASAKGRVQICQIAAGALHSCAVSASGELYTWGGGGEHQCGHGERCKAQREPRLVKPAGGGRGQKVMQVAAGALHTVVLTTARGLLACGANTIGCVGQAPHVGVQPRLTPIYGRETEG